MDAYSSVINHMSEARLGELRRQAEQHALAGAARTRARRAARARFAGWLVPRRWRPADVDVVVPLPPQATAVEELSRSA